MFEIHRWKYKKSKIGQKSLSKSNGEEWILYDLVEFENDPDHFVEIWIPILKKYKKKKAINE